MHEFRVVSWWYKPTYHCYQDVRRYQHCAFKPVGRAIVQHCVRNDHRQHEYGTVEHPEVQGHWHVVNPTYHHRERKDEERDLRGRADGDTERKIHLPLRGGGDCR